MPNYTTLLRDISNENVPVDVKMFYRVAVTQNSRHGREPNFIGFLGHGAYEAFCKDFPEMSPYLGELREVE